MTAEMSISALELERAGSHPSLTHSTTTATSDEHDYLRAHGPSESLLAPTSIPIDVQVRDNDEIEELRREAEEGRRHRGLNLSRSMQSLKGGKKVEKKEKQRSTLGRERAMTVTSSPSPPLPNLVPPMPTSRSNPAPKAKSGGFSAFLRKLKGKSSKDKSPPAAPAPAARPANAPPSRPPPAIPQPIPSMPARPPRPQRPTVETRPVSALPPQPQTAPPAAASRVSHYPVLTPIVAHVAHAPRETDPCKIPLPDSPTLESKEIAPQPPLVVDFQPAIQSQALGASSRRVKPSGMLSLEGFDFEAEDEEQEVENEQADEVRPLQPLQPLRIPSRSSDAPAISPGLSTASSTEIVMTPVSESSPERPDVRLAGSSPPRKAPVGSNIGLDRKESKWRKSVMNLSDNLPVTISRKTTTKAPPSSFDAYQAQQRRLAANRASCAPTLHSTASVAADIAGIKDKEQADIADTFFLS